MKLDRYRRYKRAGVEWIPEIPEHWSIKKVARDLPYVVGWTPPTGNDAYYDGDLPWANISDLGPRELIRTAKTISEGAVAERGATPIPKGALLFSFKLSVGAVAFAGLSMYTNEAIAAFLPTPDSDLSYLFYALPEFLPRQGRENIYGAKLLNQELIGAARLFLPPRSEQIAIAVFLDRETARIDALIEQKQRLIELLEEKRQAVITEAVTRGLDPVVPMKETGVEWMGLIPEVWSVSALRFVVTSKGGGTPDKSNEDYWGGDVLWVSPKDMKRPVIDRSIDGITEEAVSASAVNMIRVGAVLVVVRGMILAHSFPVAVAGKPLTLNQDMKALVPNHGRLSGSYLYWLLIGLRDVVLSLTDSSAHGTKTLPFDEFLRMAIPLPPLAEQNRIARTLEERVAGIDALLGKIKGSIELLSERRSSLITASVTGQIDVTEAA